MMQKQAAHDLECCDSSGLQLLALHLRHLALVACIRMSSIFFFLDMAFLSSLVPKASTSPWAGISGSASEDALWKGGRKAKSLQTNKARRPFASLHTCSAGCDLNLTCTLDTSA